jgi:hypothetical protein
MIPEFSFRANSDNEEMELIKTLNSAELREAARRCRAKSEAYLRSARLIEAWSEGKANGARAN